MLQPVSLFVGLRYLRAKRRNRFISFISFTSMIGIALGVATLITVISVMNGFELELRTRILGMVSHATVESWNGGMDDWPQVVQWAQEDERVSGAAPYVEQETMLKGRRVAGALVRGVIPEYEPQVSQLHEQMVVGSLSDLQSGEFRVLLGEGLAARLGVGPGDKVTVFAPEVRTTPAGLLPQVRRFTVSGIFAAGISDYDTALAVVHAEDAARLLRMQDQVSGVRLKLHDLLQAWFVARDLADRLPGIYEVRDWTQRHSNLFRAIRMEKVVMFVILSLIVLVAAFNIVSTLVMVVTDKQADIAILKTMGAGPRTILSVFMIQGSLIGIIGTLLGVVLGVVLALNVETIVPALERLFNVEFLSADVYYISELPSELRWMDVAKFAIVSLALTVVATIYPAWQASRTAPAEALRYE
ncbi:MAG: lipoprotein-releasing ABC transporter permease subunit [Wenzhouxiangellaceae bacterium]